MLKLIISALLLISCVAHACEPASVYKHQPDIQSPSPIDIDLLYQKLKTRKTKVDKVKEDPVKLINLILECDMLSEGVKLNIQLKQAIDAKQLDRRFLKLGFASDNLIRFTLDQKEHPYLLRIAWTFNILPHDEGRYSALDLKDRGFKPSDAQKLLNFIESTPNPQQQTSKHTAQDLSRHLSTLKKLANKDSLLANQQILSIIDDSIYRRRLIEEYYWAAWYKQLSANFDKQQQRILASYTSEYFNVETLAPDSESTKAQKTSSIINRIKNGQLAKSINSRLNNNKDK